MNKPRIAFAVPGDLGTLTGGYIYDRRLIGALRSLGWHVDHIALPAGFPDPTAAEMAQALQQLQDLPTDCPVIIDGLAFGALDPKGVTQISAPIIALVHHPLAKESGIETAKRDRDFETESQNLSQTVHVLVPSPHTAEILTSEFGVPENKITIAMPGVDQPQGAPEPIDPPLILSVGIQLPRKGHDILLRALSQITDLPWQAVIVGAALDRNYADLLATLRHDLHLTDRVQLAGQIDRDPLGQLYRQASLFALATRYEGYGIVFDEALVHGLPIVSCAAGAVPDTVPTDAGRLVPTDDPDAFAAALRLLLVDRTTCESCARASKRAGKNRPGWDTTAQRVAEAITHSSHRERI
mgnify:CR=1 FL=1